MQYIDPNTLHFLRHRRSHPPKLLTNPPPARRELMNLLELAARVPDHGKLEPWRLVVVTKPAMARLADLAEARARALGGNEEKIAKGRGQFDQGNLAVVVIYSPKAQEKEPDIEQLLSAGCVWIGSVLAGGILLALLS